MWVVFFQTVDVCIVESWWIFTKIIHNRAKVKFGAYSLGASTINECIIKKEPIDLALPNKSHHYCDCKETVTCGRGYVHLVENTSALLSTTYTWDDREKQKSIHEKLQLGCARLSPPGIVDSTGLYWKIMKRTERRNLQFLVKHKRPPQLEFADRVFILVEDNRTYP